MRGGNVRKKVDAKLPRVEILYNTGQEHQHAGMPTNIQGWNKHTARRCPRGQLLIERLAQCLRIFSRMNNPTIETVILKL